MSEVILRKEAVEKGLKTYYTGKPCKRGHLSDRFTNSGRCRDCNILTTQSWRKSSDKGGNDSYVKYKVLPSFEYIDKILKYNSLSGKVLWKYRDEEQFKTNGAFKAWNTRYANKEAGSQNYANGYIEIRFPDGLLYKAHRVAWKLHYKQEPKKIVDHKDGVPWNNSISNLREASHKQNSQNSKSNGKINYRGVTVDNSVFKVQYCVNDQNYSETGFVSAELAAERYDEIAKELYGEFARLNFKEEKVNE